MEKWQLTDGVVEFPSGRRIRARSWKAPVLQLATLSVVLTTVSETEFAGAQTFPGAKEIIMIDWPDQRLPRRSMQAVKTLQEVWQRADQELVEITCRGGVGRTGSALALIAMYEGMSSSEAIDFIRESYNNDSVTSPAQRGFLTDFSPSQVK